MKNRQANQRDTLLFIAIAVVLMLIADHFIFGGKRSYHEKIKEDYYREHPEAKRPEPVPEAAPVEEKHGALEVLPEPEPDYRDLPPPEPILPIHGETFASMKPAIEEAVMEAVVPAPEVQLASVPPVVAPAAGKKGKIVIIIDDVGMNVRNSRAVINLPGPVTLAFLPYAKQVREMARDAIAAGHETMIHVPMEAMGDNNGLGPLALRAGMDEAALTAQLDKMFASFDGYKGINNHMGSRLTQDTAKMDVVMGELRARNLYFIDSKTIGNSVAAQRARAAGIPYAERDVFLDHEESAAFVASALAHTERLAHRNGYAIAIGHPKDVTIAGLKAWIPTLKDKNLELVPASAALNRPVQSVADAPASIQPAAGGMSAPVQSPAPQP